MKIALIVFGVLALLVLAGIVASIRFSRWSAALGQRLEAAARPVDVSARLPERVRDFAFRAGASPDDLAQHVRFSQSAEMQLKAGGPWQPLDADQIVAIGETGFIWRARQSLGPLPKFQVIDAFVGGQGWLRVRLLGLVGVVNATGPDLSHGEALRYLAELPWAPDAMLGNANISWRDVDAEWVEAEIDPGGTPARVRFRFDERGDIVEVHADARATTDDRGNPASYPWKGYFRDYRMIGPRRVPASAEVGYLRPDGYRPYFQGRITGYDATH